MTEATTETSTRIRDLLAEDSELDVPYGPSEMVSFPAGELRAALRAAEVEGAVKTIGRVAEEIDEDKRYSGFDLVMWLTGLQNGIRSGSVHLGDD